MNNPEQAHAIGDRALAAIARAVFAPPGGGNHREPLPESDDLFEKERDKAIEERQRGNARRREDSVL